MLSDTREGKSEMTIFSEKGKLISTVHGMSLIMDNGSLQTTGKNGITTGTFDTFDMDLNMTEKNETAAFRVRRIPTLELVKTLFSQDNARQHKLAISELCTRLINPFMNLILTILCTLVLLKSSLLRRRTSFAPAIAVLCMSVCMGGLMSISNLINTITGFCLLFIGTITVLGLLLLMLAKK